MIMVCITLTHVHVHGVHDNGVHTRTCSLAPNIVHVMCCVRVHNNLGLC